MGDIFQKKEIFVNEERYDMLTNMTYIMMWNIHN